MKFSADIFFGISFLNRKPQRNKNTKGNQLFQNPYKQMLSVKLTILKTKTY